MRYTWEPVQQAYAFSTRGGTGNTVIFSRAKAVFAVIDANVSRSFEVDTNLQWPVASLDEDHEARSLDDLRLEIGGTVMRKLSATGVEDPQPCACSASRASAK